MSSLQERRREREKQSDGDAAKAQYVINLVAMALETTPEAVGGETRDIVAVKARHLAMYLTHVGFNLPMSRVGVAFCRDRTSIAHAVARVEAMRDDPAFDARVLALEAAVRHAPAARFP